ADDDIGPRPQNAGPIATSLAQYPGGPTVIRPALHGALDYATSHAANHRDERVYVVLLAGGPPPTPDPCVSDTIDDAASAAAASNTKTFVVTFDYDSPPGPSLEPIATRGGRRLFSFDPR